MRSWETVLKRIPKDFFWHSSSDSQQQECAAVNHSYLETSRSRVSRPIKKLRSPWWVTCSLAQPVNAHRCGCFTLLAELWYEPSDSLCTTVFRCRPSGRNNTATALLFYSLQHPGGFCFNRSFWTNVCRVNKSKLFSRGTKQDCWSSITNRRHAASLAMLWLAHSLGVGEGGGQLCKFRMISWVECVSRQANTQRTINV